jgi:hypothetical protein
LIASDTVVNIDIQAVARPFGNFHLDGWILHRRRMREEMLDRDLHSYYYSVEGMKDIIKICSDSRHLINFQSTIE